MLIATELANLLGCRGVNCMIGRLGSGGNLFTISLQESELSLIGV